MYSTSSGRGFLPLVTAAHEISPTCSCMCNPGEEECMIHIRVFDLYAGGHDVFDLDPGGQRNSSGPLCSGSLTWIDSKNTSIENFSKNKKE